MMTRVTISLALLALVSGCAQTRSYSIAVKNESNRPITIGLAKEGGGPYEGLWATPEELAMDADSNAEHVWGRVVEPGRTAEAGVSKKAPLNGKFEKNARAMLRVYGGDMPLSGILATSRGDPERLDIPLAEGENRFIVTRERGRLNVARAE